MHQKGGVPDDVPEFVADAGMLRDGLLWLPAALALTKLVASNSDGKRMVQGGGVRVSGEVVKDPTFGLPPGRHLLQVGKNKASYVVVPG